MRVFYKNGVLDVKVNVLINIEKCSALKNWFDFINPLIQSWPIERINTNTSEAIYPHLLCRLFDEGNDYAYKLVLITNFSLTSKGLCCFILVILGYELIVCLVDIGRFGLLFVRENINLGSHIKRARLKLMISKDFQEPKNFPLQIISDDGNLVVPAYDILFCLIPFIVCHEWIFCHDEGRYWLNPILKQIIIFENGTLSFTLEDNYCGTNVPRNTPRTDQCYSSTSVLCIR